MTERNDHLAEGYLVDGVAPPVIGGAESPEPPTADEEYDDFRPNTRREEFQPGTRREPPTTPIPAQSPPATGYGGQGQQDERKGWLGRMFGGR